MSLPQRGTFAVVGSTTYEVTTVAHDAVTLRVPRDAGRLPSHLESGVRRDGDSWAKVRKSDLERYFAVSVTVEWQGERFDLGRVTGDRAEIHSDSPPVADRLGLEGDQYNGFRATVPVAELTVVDVREKEIHV
ncbi:hypothetical protein [Nocardioides astragali]|uniref:Uncharacterized protein n=1 Tax=Nocardioides astragali TaxID=1776736 RepID=A0ABW2MY44_9ACTN|nr:hypothetical protein [Nocardioides astragali]